MAGLTDFCGQIVAGFDPCGKTPGVAGIEAGIYAFNKGDFTFTFDAANPLIVTGITRVGTSLMYKIIGFGDTFNAVSKASKKSVGPRFTETLTAYISDNSSATKQFVVNALTGRQQYIIVNNDKSGDGAVELYGAINGLQLSENTQRDAADEDMQGAWKLEATNPPKLLEAYPPRSVAIPPGTGSATYASTIAALDAFLIPAA